MISCDRGLVGVDDSGSAAAAGAIASITVPNENRESDGAWDARGPITECADSIRAR